MSQAALIPFFFVHYGMFWLVHGVFVLTLPLFGEPSEPGGDRRLDDAAPTRSPSCSP